MLKFAIKTKSYLHLDSEAKMVTDRPRLHFKNHARSDQKSTHQKNSPWHGQGKPQPETRLSIVLLLRRANFVGNS